MGKTSIISKKLIPTNFPLELDSQHGCDKSMMKFKDPNNVIGLLYIHDIVGFN